MAQPYPVQSAPVQPGYVGGRRLRSLRPLAVLLTCGLLAQFVFAALLVRGALDIRDWLNSAEATNGDVPDPHNLVLRVEHANVGFIVSFIVTGIATMFWTYFARANADLAAPAFDPARSRPWAIWGWICPVVSLWFPYQVVRDIGLAQDEVLSPNGDQPRQWTTRLWWILMLANNVVGLAVRGTTIDPTADLQSRVAQVRTLVNELIALLSLIAVAGALFLAVVVRLSRGNERMRSLEFRQPTWYPPPPPAWGQPGPGLSYPPPGYPAYPPPGYPPPGYPAYPPPAQPVYRPPSPPGESVYRPPSPPPTPPPTGPAPPGGHQHE